MHKLLFCERKKPNPDPKSNVSTEKTSRKQKQHKTAPKSQNLKVKNSMKAFDKLPPNARKQLANSPANWATQPFVTQMRKGYTEEMLCRSIRVNDEDYLKNRRRKSSTYKVYGANHPEA